MIKKKAFVKYNLDDKPKDDIFTVKLNEGERLEFERFKEIIEQTKDSTALKQLAWIGAKVLLEDKQAFILGVIYANKRKNKRNNIIEFD